MDLSGGLAGDPLPPERGEAPPGCLALRAPPPAAIPAMTMRSGAGLADARRRRERVLAALAETTKDGFSRWPPGWRLPG